MDKQIPRSNLSSCTFPKPYCQFSEFSFIIVFCYFCWQFSTIHNLLRNFFVKSQCSLLKNFHLTEKKSQFLFKFFFSIFFSSILIASYGARVRGSVIKIHFRAFSREFEYIQTSPGFAQLLGENWG